MMMQSLPEGFEAVVVGASGGVGGALADALEADPRAGTVRRLGRSLSPSLDLTDETTIAAAAEAFEAPRLVVVATGYLHGPQGGPEKRLADLDPARLAHSFAVNAIGPALVLKHVIPRLPRAGRSLVAVLTARVGSITDNRSGGWYGYRASKAAANQIVRTAAIELQARRPEAICVALHPGTVATGLSAPFVARTPAERLFGPERAAAQLLAVLDGLTPADNGRFLAWDGQAIPF
jgi:NAD(P)-dependent dehydrogenase (short-subunit alcohol dehydrogenase family)